jgi:hypothetical protein
MKLLELFNRIGNDVLNEGGNLQLPGGEQAQQIDLKVTNRSIIVPILNQLLRAINQDFEKKYKEPLWNAELLNSGEFLSGSSLHFFNVKGISDEDFVAKKPKVGDIDTQVSKDLEEKLKSYLESTKGQVVGPAKHLGFQEGNEQFSSLWELTDVPIKVQIDLEFVKFDSGRPTDWSQFSHSSSWDDLSAGVKGVFHKYFMRALTAAKPTEKYVARQLKKGVKIADEPTSDNDLSFAVASKQGGGLRQKYKPYIDSETGQTVKKNGIPVMLQIGAADANYIQDLSEMFNMLFGFDPTDEDKKSMWSFVGGLTLANKYLSDAQRQQAALAFVNNLFGRGAQGLYRGDPERDRSEKQAALDLMLKNLKLSDVAAVKSQAESDAKEYYEKYKVSESVFEDEVVASKRKGIVHLEKMKDLDFLDLLDELKDQAGNFKLDSVPMTVKVDGMGGRIGKDRSGRPFFESSSSGPIFTPGAFSSYQQQRGVTDPVQLTRAENYDQLWKEAVGLIKKIDQELGEDFLKDVKVHTEVLYAPMAEEIDGKLKFVSVAYDRLPRGVKLALVPLFAEVASTGEEHPNSAEIVKQLRNLGRVGSTMFVDNSLTSSGAIDVTAVVKPLESIAGLRDMVSGTKRAARAEAKELLAPVKQSLARAVIENPNIVGKDKLGQDYEGIILYTKKGPVKITSDRFKELMSLKRPTAESQRVKPAVVTVGSFVGHKGHQQLVDLTINKAKELGGDAYVYISSKVGPDDPIPPEVKLQTWKKLYPNNSDIFKLIVSPDGVGSPSPIKKIEKELVLPADSPYNKIILLVGTDRYDGFKKWMETLERRMKDPDAVAKYGGTQNQVEFETIKTNRGADEGGTGVSFTDLRNILKDLNASEDEKVAAWAQGFDSKKLGLDYVKDLMSITKKGMGMKENRINKIVQQVLESQSWSLTETHINLNRYKKITNENVSEKFDNELDENVSEESAIRGIVSTGESIRKVFEDLKTMAKKWVEDQGELKGFPFIAGGRGKRWYDEFYWNRMETDLQTLVRKNPRATEPLRQFFGGERDAKGHISFIKLSRQLPKVLVTVGKNLKSEDLENFGRNWFINNQDFEQYLKRVEHEVYSDNDQTSSDNKKPRDSAVGQQNAAANDLVSQVLNSLDRRVAGDIRNAIARDTNKIAALQRELAKRNIKIGEDLEEGWKQKLAALGIAGALGLGSVGGAQASTDPAGDKIVATLSIEGETKTLDLSSKNFKDVREARDWLERFLEERGIENWNGVVERGVKGSGKYQRASTQNTTAGLGAFDRINKESAKKSDYSRY